MPHALLETGLIFLLCFLIGGWLPPDVNEAHYLCKARHYWDPTWCVGDVFLESADAHLVFYWTLGWLAALVSLPATAWIGRLATWIMLAWAWRRLSFAVIPRPWVSVLTVAVYFPLQFGGHMAGEWVVGGVEAKGFAYVLMLLGLEALVRRKWGRMWISFGAASAFHVLVGGWSVVAGFIAYGLAGNDRPPLRSMLPALVAGGLLSLLGLLPTAALNMDVGADLIGQANWIYVYGRLSHHLVFTQFDPLRIAAHFGLLAVWLCVALLTRARGLACADDDACGDDGDCGDDGQRQLQRFVAGAVAIAVIGVLLSLLPRSTWTTALLRLYWFRLSDAVLPLGVAFGLVGSILHWRETSRPRLGTVLLSLAIVLPAAFFVIRYTVQQRDMRPPSAKQTRPLRSMSAKRLRKTYEDWVRLGIWIRNNTEDDAVFITPRAQQSFHWVGQRAEVACWKDVPQDAASMVQWWERMQALYPPEVIEQGLVWHGETRLNELAHRYDAQYVIIDRTVSGRGLRLRRVYPTSAATNDSFEIYRVNRANLPPPDAD